MRVRPWSASLLALTAMLCAAACAMDPVASALESAEESQPDLGLKPNSALHRPGSDCMACHGPRGSAEPKFEVAGTVFWGSCDASNEERDGMCDPRPAVRAEVRIRDANKGTRCVRTNCAGNFYIRRGDWAGGASRGGSQISGARPKFPLLTSVSKTLDDGTVRERFMAGHISRAGSCNDCHRTAGYWNSPGQIRLFDANDQVPPQAQSELESCLQNPEQPIETIDCDFEEQL